jgi:branched-subunit amino acid transport protein
LRCPAAALAAIVVPDILLVSGTFSPLNAKLAAAVAAAAATLTIAVGVTWPPELMSTGAGC